MHKIATYLDQDHRRRDDRHGRAEAADIVEAMSRLDHAPVLTGSAA